MWFLHWDQVIMKCIQLQNYAALCLCGQRIPDAPFEGLLRPSVCSRLETFTQYMFIFCWITTMQPCLHLEGHVLQVGARNAQGKTIGNIQRVQWQRTLVASTPEQSNVSLQNCHKRTAEKCNKAICWSQLVHPFKWKTTYLQVANWKGSLTGEEVWHDPDPRTLLCVGGWASYSQ